MATSKRKANGHRVIAAVSKSLEAVDFKHLVTPDGMAIVSSACGVAAVAFHI